jgi:hypothetical protein
VHSPLVGPLTWSLVAEELRRRGVAALTPALVSPREGSRRPFWQRHARAAAKALRASPPGAVVLAGHSGAGPLLPAIRQEAGRPVAVYLFVDAGLPVDGQSRLEEVPFGAYLRALYARGERFPNWTDADLAALVPDPALRARLRVELRPQPWAFWQEPIPVFAGWLDAPCAYLRFAPNPAYDAAAAAAAARARGWPCAELSGGHFHMLVDPVTVAEALIDLARRAGGGDGGDPARYRR